MEIPKILRYHAHETFSKTKKKKSDRHRAGTKRENSHVL